MITNDRRAFLKRCFGTTCGFSATLLLSPLLSRKAFGREIKGEKIEEKPFARIEKLHDGVYALISTPFTKGGKAGDLSTHALNNTPSKLNTNRLNNGSQTSTQQKLLSSKLGNSLPLMAQQPL